MAFFLVLLVVLLTTGFVFAYHFVARSQSGETHFRARGEVVARMALNGTEFCADLLNRNDPDIRLPLRTLDAIDLFSAAEKKEIVLSTGTCSPEGSPKQATRLLDRIAGDFQKLLLAHDIPGRNPTGAPSVPRCDGIGVRFTSLQKIHPQPPRAAEMAAGWDAVEKSGTAEISCRITFDGMTRTAISSRQFKVVSMIPGPYARCTLFTQ